MHNALADAKDAIETGLARVAREPLTVAVQMGTDAAAATAMDLLASDHAISLLLKWDTYKGWEFSFEADDGHMYVGDDIDDWRAAILKALAKYPGARA